MTRTSPIVRFFSGTVLLLFYVAGTIGVEWLHRAVHEKAQTELHTPEAERNNCHLALFHQATDCGHDQHIAEATGCDHCEFIGHQVYDFQIDIFVPNEKIKPFAVTAYVRSVTQTSEACLSLRGPPTVVGVAA